MLWYVPPGDCFSAWSDTFREVLFGFSFLQAGRRLRFFERIAELISSNKGLGHFISASLGLYQVDGILAGLILFVALRVDVIVMLDQINELFREMALGSIRANLPAELLDWTVFRQQASQKADRFRANPAAAVRRESWKRAAFSKAA